MPTPFLQARQALGLNIKQMAACLGVHRDTYGKWERGEQSPPAIAESHIRLLIWLKQHGLIKYKYLLTADWQAARFELFTTEEISNVQERR